MCFCVRVCGRVRRTRRLFHRNYNVFSCVFHEVMGKRCSSEGQRPVAEVCCGRGGGGVVLTVLRCWLSSWCFRSSFPPCCFIASLPPDFPFPPLLLPCCLSFRYLSYLLLSGVSFCHPSFVFLCFIFPSAAIRFIVLLLLRYVVTIWEVDFKVYFQPA